MAFGFEKIRDSLFGFRADFGSVFAFRAFRGWFGKAGEAADGAEAEAMLGGDAVAFKGGKVLLCAVAFVFFKVVVGVIVGEVDHVVIAGDFGEDGGGGDFFDEIVAFHEGGDVAREGGVGEEIAVAVDDDFGEADFRKVGAHVGDGAASGEAESCVHADFVEFVVPNPTEAGGGGFCFDDVAENIATFFGKFF